MGSKRPFFLIFIIEFKINCKKRTIGYIRDEYMQNTDVSQKKIIRTFDVARRSHSLLTASLTNLN